MNGRWYSSLILLLMGCSSNSKPGVATASSDSTSITSGPTSTDNTSSAQGSTSTATLVTSSTATSASSNSSSSTGMTSSGGGSTSTSTAATAAGGSGGTTSGTSTGSGGTAGGSGESKFLLFLLIGQSNMEGAPQPEAQDRTEDPRIQVLAYDNCTNIGRNYNEWYPASPPLHSCGAGVGPGDYFAKTLLEGLPEGYSIGLIPLGVNGAPIDVFRKDVPRPGWELPPDNHWETGFEWIVSRAQLAQEQGEIRGILFHQGESDAGQEVWVDKVAGFVADLRTDLGLGNAPFLAGEVYRDGMAAAHNTLINQLPDVIDNAHVISSSDLKGTDVYHFDLPSQRELGRRYGETMLQLLAPTLSP